MKNISAAIINNAGIINRAGIVDQSMLLAHPVLDRLPLHGPPAVLLPAGSPLNTDKYLTVTG